MATAKQLRSVFAPILAQYPDLVLHKRWLIRPPIETAIIGLYIEPLSAPSDGRMDLSVIPLSRFHQPTALGYRQPFEVERVIGEPAPNRLLANWRDLPPRIFQDMFAAEFEAHLIRNFNAKVPAFFATVRSVEDVIAWVTSLRGSFFFGGPPEHIDGWVALMRGCFDEAANQLQAYLDRLRKSDAGLADRRRQQHGSLLAILRTNDATAIAAHLHAMEERTIAHYGLQRYWRRTPFPFERAARASAR